MQTSFKPIKPRKISDQVCEQIKKLIDLGELPPGSRLLSERALSQALDVSRTVVREAIQRLTAMGLLVQYQGRGTFVLKKSAPHNNYLSAMIKTHDVSLNDFLEIRLAFECQAAYLAAQRANDSDISAMENSIDTMRIEAARGKFNIKADIKFHKAIANAAKNPLHAVIETTLNYWIVNNISNNINRLEESVQTVPLILAQHKKIFKAIKERNPVDAFNAMEEHIKFIIRIMTVVPLTENDNPADKELTA